ncbi:ribosome biogenesis protein SLX9-domain-containing protein, partial [Mycena sp. CBHHK59/15]
GGSAWAHDPSVKLVKRQFAVQDNAVEHVDVGVAAGQSVWPTYWETVSSSRNQSRQQRFWTPWKTRRVPDPKKKEKQQLKRDALLQRLESNHSPYSKSHARRQKRKAKEQIAGGLDDIQAALAAVEGEQDVDLHQDSAADELDIPEHESQPKKAKPKPGQIGEGKGVPLSKAQRHGPCNWKNFNPLILANPEFSTNPFQTIRTHAKTPCCSTNSNAFSCMS